MVNIVLWIGLGVLAVALVVVGVFLFIFVKRNKRVEIPAQDIQLLAEFVKVQKQEIEQKQELKVLEKAIREQKNETFKQTKEQLLENLKQKFDEKQWKPLESILKSADKGGIGIYVLYNSTKEKYYVGQAKQLYKRVRDHFKVEEIARDQISGDTISVKFLTANELGEDYRMDHIEKTGIEIFNAGVTGYNKTAGNV